MQDLHDIDEVINDFKELLKKTHNVKQIKKHLNNYLGSEFKGISDNFMPDFKDQISKDGMKIHAKEGREFIDVILISLFQFGYEQGCIVTEEKHRPDKERLRKIDERMEKDYEIPKPRKSRKKIVQKIEESILDLSQGKSLDILDEHI